MIVVVVWKQVRAPLHCIYMLSLRLHVLLHASVGFWLHLLPGCHFKEGSMPSGLGLLCRPADARGHQGCEIHQNGDLSDRTPDGLRGLNVRSTEYRPFGRSRLTELDARSGS